MKNLYLLFIALFLFSISATAQVVPPGMNYQAVARDHGGTILANKNISLQVALVTDGDKKFEYIEQHQITTNDLGLFTLVIGDGKASVGSFEEVPWSTNQVWIELSIDANGGSDYTLIHTSKLLAVPYAFHAGTAEEVTGGTEERGGWQSKPWFIEGDQGTDPDIHFVGNLDSVDLVFRTNNTERMRITAGGRVLATKFHADIANFTNVVIEELVIQNDLLVQGNLDVEGLSTLHELVVQRDVDLNTDGGETTINGPTAIHNTLDVDESTHLNIEGGSTLIEGPTTIRNTLDVDESTHLNIEGGTTTIDGVTTITNVTNSTNPTNGALNVDGGVGIEKDMNVTGKVHINFNEPGNTTTVDGVTTITNVTNSTNPTNGALNVDGGVGIEKDMNVTGKVHINYNSPGNTTTVDGVTTITNVTNSTNPTNGALNVDGGVGIEKDMNVTGKVHINFNEPGNTTTIDGVTTITNVTNSTNPTNGALNVDGGVGIEKDMNVTGKVHINFNEPGNTTTIDGVTTITNVTNSTNPTNGALNVDGGVGIEKDMNVTGKVHINFNEPGNTTTIDGVTTITNVTNSTNPTNGALNVDGGVGIEKDMNVTGKVHINFNEPGNTTTIDGVTTITNVTNSTNPTNGALNVDGGVGIEKDMNVTGKVHINYNSPGNTTTIDGVTTITNTTNSTAPTNGALNVDGGVGIEQDMNVGGHTKIDKTLRVITDDNSTGVAGGYVAHFENKSDGDGICIQVGSGAPTHGNNFITFKNSGGTVVGRIEGETLGDLPNNDDYQQELDFYDIDIDMANKEIDMEENERTMAIADAAITAGEVVIAGLEVAMVAREAASSAGSVQPVPIPCGFPTPCASVTAPNSPWIANAVLNAVDAGANLATAIANQVLADINVGLAGDNVDLANENKADNEMKKQEFMNLYQLQIGVTYESGAGDYAEYLPKLNPEEDYKPGEVVGLKGGVISRNTLGADRVMVISLKPAVLGALPKEGTEGNFEKVAFLGQLLTKTMGKVSRGDYILPSGFHNGAAIAKHPSEMLMSDYNKIIGVAWGDSESDGLNYVNVAVGLNTNDMSIVIQQQQQELENLKNQIAQTNNILADLVPGFKEAANMTASTADIASVNTQPQYDLDRVEPAATNGKYIIPNRSDYEAGINKARQNFIEKGIDIANHPFWNRLDTDPDYLEEVINDMDKMYSKALDNQLELDKQK